MAGRSDHGASRFRSAGKVRITGSGMKRSHETFGSGRRSSFARPEAFQPHVLRPVNLEAKSDPSDQLAILIWNSLNEPISATISDYILKETCGNLSAHSPALRRSTPTSLSDRSSTGPCNPVDPSSDRLKASHTRQAEGSSRPLEIGRQALACSHRHHEVRLCRLRMFIGVRPRLLRGRGTMAPGGIGQQFGQKIGL